MAPEDDDADNLKRVIEYLARQRPKSGGVPLWAVVHDLTGNGSSVSMRICRRHGCDPDTMVTKPSWYDPETTHVRAWCEEHQKSHDMDEACPVCEAEEVVCKRHGTVSRPYYGERCEHCAEDAAQAAEMRDG